MPQGKPAGVACVHLKGDFRCELFGRPERPAFCGSLQPSLEMCGQKPGDALAWLAALELATQPDGGGTSPAYSSGSGMCRA